MQPIEVRAWDKLEKTMWYDVLKDLGDHDIYDDEASMWSVAHMMTTGDTSRFIFMLFANKVDKNNKKIFEQDDVVLENYPSKKFTVLSENGTWVLKNDEGVAGNLFYFKPEEIEICEKEFEF